MSPLFPELITKGDTLDDAFDNLRDALAAVLEIHHEMGKPLPPDLGGGTADPASGRALA